MEKGARVDSLLARWDASKELAKHGVSFLLWGLLDDIVDGHFEAVQSLDGEIEALEDEPRDEEGHELGGDHRRPDGDHWLLRAERALSRFRSPLGILVFDGAHHRAVRWPVPGLPASRLALARLLGHQQQRRHVALNACVADQLLDVLIPLSFSADDQVGGERDSEAQQLGRTRAQAICIH
jgi:Mg2+ and Co2+ transporter CorA